MSAQYELVLTAVPFRARVYSALFGTYTQLNILVNVFILTPVRNVGYVDFRIPYSPVTIFSSIFLAPPNTYWRAS